MRESGTPLFYLSIARGDEDTQTQRTLQTVRHSHTLRVLQVTLPDGTKVAVENVACLRAQGHTSSHGVVRHIAELRSEQANVSVKPMKAIGPRKTQRGRGRYGLQDLSNLSCLQRPRSPGRHSLRSVFLPGPVLEIANGT